MFRITNNNISITRGETATYDAVFKHFDGTPLTLDKNLVSDDKSVYGLFSVKLSMYDEDAVFRVPMKLDDLAKFDTNADIITISDNQGSFDDTYVPDYSIIFEKTTKVPTGDTSQYWKGSYYTYIGLGRQIDPATLATTTVTWTDTTTSQTVNAPVKGAWFMGGSLYLTLQPLGGGYKNYIVNETNKTLTPITWTGVTISGENVWSDGTTTYHSTDGSGVFYAYNTSTSTWVTVATTENVRGSYVWSDGTDTYYSKNSTLTGTIVDNHLDITYKWDKLNGEWVEFSTNRNVDGDAVCVVDSHILCIDNGDTLEFVNGIWESSDYNLGITSTKKVFELSSTKAICYESGNMYINTDDFSNREDKLYKWVIAGVPTYYVYVGDSRSVTSDDFEEYEFRMVFPFPYNIMKTLQPKLYKYEIALVGGTPTGTISDQTAITTQLPLTVDFKQYLVEFKDFKVEGSLSE